MSEQMSTSKVLFEKGKAGYAAVYMVSPEDQRSLREVKKAAAELGRKLFYWTEGKGLIEDGKARASYEPNTEGPPDVLNFIKEQCNPQARSTKIPEKSIVVLRLFHHFLEASLIQAQLLDIIPDLKMSQRMIVIQSPVIKMPPELEKELALVEMTLPGTVELQEVLQGIITGTDLPADKRPSPERTAELIEAAKGLTASEAENAFSLALLRPRLRNKNAPATALWDPKVVLDEKCQALKKTGLLEYIPVDESGLANVGGLDHLKDWVRLRKNAFTEKARVFGLPQPKGILLVGPPGAGKSLCAKAISSELHKPLLKLDMGKLFGSLVGQSEANIRLAIAIAEAVAPCILWLDEIEKGVAGASAGALDSGVGARVLGTLLTWMQEKTSPVFVYATANDVTALPPELLRKGRFDEMFSVDLPSMRERKEILNIHLNKRKRGSVATSTEKFQGATLTLDVLAGDTTEGFTGAEIEGALIESMYAAFDDNEREVKLSDLQTAFDSTQPISKTMQERLGRLREWCKVRTRPANKTEPQVVQVAAGSAPAPTTPPQVGAPGRKVSMN
jgi:SpoVK/Ycf46/Vps4 family AAA+-type ATPase